MPTASPTDYPDHVVTAVLVAHDGAPWLPRALAGLAAQARPPDTVLAVDTGSSDGSAALLAEALGEGQVSHAPASTGFGAAVMLALAERAPQPDEPPQGKPPVDEQPTGEHPTGAHPTTVQPTDAQPAAKEWIWLLHDDVEAHPDALAALLALVDADPSVGVAGPKVRGWNDPRVLLETGVTIARSGRRETGLERREHDQGQHDGVRAVLAVGTAGMLVRRDVWDALRGLDPRLPLFRDDLDFGWRANLAGHRVVCVTDSVVHHAESASHGRRQLRATADRHHRVDRQHAIYVLLANLPLLALPWALVRLTAGTLLRMLGLLIGKLPGHALDELRALVAVVCRPDRLVRARLRRRRTRTMPARSVRPLLAKPGTGMRHLLETTSLLLGMRAGLEAGAGAHRALETGPAAEEVEDLPRWGGGRVRHLLTRSWVLLVLALTVLALVAARDLLGDGRLMGGALFPAPDSAGDLWRSYTGSWHPVGLGSDTPAPPYLAALASLGMLLVGNASLAVDLLFLGAVPLAALTAYLALGRVVSSQPVRIWGAVTYALLPPVLGAVAAGRIGTVAVAVLLPLAARSAARAVTAGRLPGPARKRTARAAWTAGLLLAVMAAFAPMVYLCAGGLALAAIAAGLRDRTALRSMLVILVVPVALLLPWLPAFVSDPGLLLLEAGLPGPGLADPTLPPVAVLLLHPGGPGMYPVVFTAGLVLAALAALLRRDRRQVILGAWVAALVGIVGGILVSRARVSAPTLEMSVAAWPGPMTLLAGAGMLLAATVGADGIRHRIARSSFGWRQPTALVVAAAAAVVPVLAAGWWVVSGADGPLQRRDPVLVPAFVAAEGERPSHPRTLVLRPRADGRLAYTLLRDEGPRIGDAETAPPSAAGTGLDEVVADLASGRGGDAAQQLVPYGVGYVLMGPPVDVRLARAIDRVPGLVRVSGPAGSVVWRVAYPSGRLRIVDATGAGDTVLPSGQVGAQTQVPAGAAGRRVAVADRGDSGWQATLDGTPLAAKSYDGWAQAFALPANGGLFELSHEDSRRQALLWAQAAALVLVVVLALPSARAEEDSDVAEPVDEPARQLTESRS